MHTSELCADGTMRLVHRPSESQHGHHYAGILSSTISSHGGRTLWPRDPRLDERLCTTLLSESHSGSLSGGGLGASGAGRPDGRDVRPVGGRNPDGSPRFDQNVRPGGYLWWYVDALSDDGQYGLTVIAFVGSVFSPYYYWARQRDPNTNPENHCAINVAIYGRGVRRWSMTERGRRHVSRDAHHFQVGPSQLRWTGQYLELDLNEWSVPIP